MKTMRTNMTKGGCVHTLLIRGTQHEVSYCTCGNVHLTWGSVTLRLQPEDFEALAESLCEASHALGKARVEVEVPRLLV